MSQTELRALLEEIVEADPGEFQLGRGLHERIRAALAALSGE